MSSVPDTLIGIEIGGTKLQLVLGEASGKIAQRWRATVEPARGGPGICQQIDKALSDLSRDGAARAIGVGFGGPIDWRTGRIQRSHQIDGWENFNLRQWLSERAAVPVRVDNDANTAALGEALAGAGVGNPGPLFYVTLGSGVGGGLVTDGEIYHGAPPGESEFGHLRLDRKGAIVESRCSGWAVDTRIRAAASEEHRGELARLARDHPGNEARHLAAALAAGDPVARRLLEEIGDDLAFALSHVVQLMHPRLIVLGGGLSLTGEPLRAEVEARLPQYVMKALHPAPAVRLARLQEDAVPVGALLLAGMALQRSRLLP